MLRNLFAALVAAFVLVFAACGGDDSGSSTPSTPADTPAPTDNVTPTDDPKPTEPAPTMEPVTDFSVNLDLACRENCTALFEWTCGQSAIWAVFATVDETVMRLVDKTEVTNATVTLDDRFRGKMATFWTQRVDANGNPFGPKSNTVTVGPIMPDPKIDYSLIEGFWPDCFVNGDRQSSGTMCTVVNEHIARCEGMFQVDLNDRDKIEFSAAWFHYTLRQEDGFLSSDIECTR